jgi:hypothetical protein
MNLPLGPLTTFMTSCAAAVGAGIVLGGFVAGVAGLLASLDRERLEWVTRVGGYWGGGAGLFALAVDNVS